ncbi:MAG TPA: hypothetical protein VK582_00405 [Pyrinomonadaceae bacterium]|nr:hypothetical protein [Pyrinomonadaceae bacterium]
MTELDHDNLGYRGTAGETVTMTVSPLNALITYNLRGAGHVPFPPSRTLQFQLIAGDNRLELLLDSEGDADTFTVVLRPIQNETNNECVHTWKYHGSPMEKDFVFST